MNTESNNSIPSRITVFNLLIAFGADLMRSVPNGHLCFKNGRTFCLWNIIRLNSSPDQQRIYLRPTRFSSATNKVGQQRKYLLNLLANNTPHD